MNNHILRNAIVTFASFIFVITIVGAWTAPGATPPNGNVSAPLTIGATSQSKVGGLDVGWLSAVGSIKVGTTNAVCSALIGGSLRYNSTIKCIEFCDETSWKCTNQSAVQPPCTLPWGGTMASGSSTVAYSQASVPSGQTCASVSETRTCGLGGNLSGSFTNQSCTVLDSYSWSTSAWGSCSGTCGSAGTQTRTVSCTRGSDNAQVADLYCSGVKPASSQACTLQCDFWKPAQDGSEVALTYYWYVYGMGGGAGPWCTTHTYPAAGQPALPLHELDVTYNVIWYDHGWFSAQFGGRKPAGQTHFTSGTHCVHQGGLIQYLFTTPQPSTYSWIVTGWSGCADNDWDGYYEEYPATFACRRNRDSVQVADSYCSGAKPSSPQSCTPVYYDYGGGGG